MTFVGKILVFVILVFALCFLAVSTVVFSTAKNWKEEVTKQKEQVAKAQGEKTKVQTELDARKGELDKAKADHIQQVQLLNTQVAQLQEETKQAKAQLSDQIKVVETSQENAKAAQAEAKARLEETTELRTLLADVQQSANELKLHQTMLNDEVRILKRDLDVAQENNRDLRDRVAVLSTTLNGFGIKPNIEQLRSSNTGTAPSQDIEGVVTRVQGRGNDPSTRIELSIGSDDGIAARNELDIYRLDPPEYLGKVKVEIVTNDHAVGQLVGHTRNGLKVKEGDIVASQIRSRR
ncbi:MAG: hypothetical protein ABI353_21950 [Isosphaeraceae bacterium]